MLYANLVEIHSFDWSNWQRSHSVSKLFVSHPGLAVHYQLIPRELNTVGPDVRYARKPRFSEFTAAREHSVTREILIT